MWSMHHVKLRDALFSREKIDIFSRADFLLEWMMQTQTNEILYSYMQVKHEVREITYSYLIVRVRHVISCTPTIM